MKLEEYFKEVVEKQHNHLVNISKNYKALEMTGEENLNKTENNMKKEKYLNLSERTNKSFPEGRMFTSKEMDLLHAAMGLVTEASEFMDMLKKYLIYGKELDEVNLSEELGDSFWYAALALRTLKTDFEEVMNTNIKKLELRYPEKFTEYHALNRNLEGEREILEKN